VGIFQQFGSTPGTGGYSQCHLDLKLAADQAAVQNGELMLKRIPCG